MKELKSVFKKINDIEKVELESHVIELASVAEIKKLISPIEKNWDSALKTKLKIDGLKKDAINSFRDARVLANKGLAEILDFEKQVKTLGLELPTEIITIKNRMERYLDEGGKEITNLQ